jgi:hypothetical protein
LVTGEITQMAQTTSYVLRNAGNYYEHGGVSQGFTFQNQIMGQVVDLETMSKPFKLKESRAGNS